MKAPRVGLTLATLALIAAPVAHADPSDTDSPTSYPSASMDVTVSAPPPPPTTDPPASRAPVPSAQTYGTNLAPPSTASTPAATQTQESSDTSSAPAATQSDTPSSSAGTTDSSESGSITPLMAIGGAIAAFVVFMGVLLGLNRRSRRHEQAVDDEWPADWRGVAPWLYDNERDDATTHA